MLRKRLATVLAAALVPAAMLDGAGAASAAPGGAQEGEKTGKGAPSGFTTEGSKRLTTSESS